MTIEQSPEQQARVEDFQRRHQIRLLTLLFTDVVGSTRLKQLLGERAAIELTERHHAQLREILLRFADAEEIDTAGDSFFMVFAKPSDAVQFALLAQRAVRELARETGQPLLDRIGIHVGEVFIQDRGSERRNLFGIQIDSTARIMSLGQADQILLSRFAFDNARLVLHGFDMPGIGELSWLNHGYYELKGVEEPLEVCEVGETGLAALTPPDDSEKAHRFHAADAEPVLGWRPAAGQLVPETRWKLERPLGQGGFGEVWLAEHETLKQPRVLKFCFKAERARSLKREATLFRVLRERFEDHPNIVAIHDVFFDESPFYLVMDFVDGPSLDRWTGAHATLAATPLEQRLELVAQIADALQAAHDSGIIHRDVKPSNVLIADAAGTTPRAKLVDFGIGQVVNAEALAGVTRLGFTNTMLYTGSGTGTPLYQAPELLAGKPATTRSDLYSLGVVLWQMVIGDFARPLATDWEDQIADPLLREDIQRCVAGDPAKRFASAAQLSKRLRTLPERGRALEQEKARRAEAERRAYRRGLLRAATAATVLVAIFAALAFYAFRQAQLAHAEKRRADEERQKAEIARERAVALPRILEAQARSAALLEAIAPFVGKTAGTDILKRAEDLVGGLSNETLDDARLRVGQANLRRVCARLYLRLGRDSKALEHAEAARQIVLAELRRNPKSEAAPGTVDQDGLKQLLGECHLLVGDVIIGGHVTAFMSKKSREDYERAMKNYDEAAQLARSERAAHSNEAGWRQIYYSSMLKSGDTEALFSRASEAQKRFTENAAELRTLRIKDPAAVDLRGFEASFHERLGTLYLETSEPDAARLDKARSEFDEAFRLRETGANMGAEEDLQRLSDKAQSFSKLGQLARSQKDSKTALTYFQRDLAIRRKLYEQNPRQDWARNLSSSVSNVAQAAYEDGQYELALQLYAERMKFAEDLLRKNENDANLRNDYVTSLFEYVYFLTDVPVVYDRLKALELARYAVDRTERRHPKLLALLSRVLRLNELPLEAVAVGEEAAQLLPPTAKRSRDEQKTAEFVENELDLSKCAAPGKSPGK